MTVNNNELNSLINNAQDAPPAPSSTNPPPQRIVNTMSELVFSLQEIYSHQQNPFIVQTIATEIVALNTQITEWTTADSATIAIQNLLTKTGVGSHSLLPLAQESIKSGNYDGLNDAAGALNALGNKITGGNGDWFATEKAAGNPCACPPTISDDGVQAVNTLKTKLSDITAEMYSYAANPTTPVPAQIKTDLIAVANDFLTLQTDLKTHTDPHSQALLRMLNSTVSADLPSLITQSTNVTALTVTDAQLEDFAATLGNPVAGASTKTMQGILATFLTSEGKGSN